MAAHEGINGHPVVMEVEEIAADDERSGARARKSKKKAHGRKTESFCFCGDGDGDMIGCDGVGCEGGGWYHAECLQEVLGMSAQRSKRLRGDWFCPSCTEKAAKAMKNTKKMKIPRSSANSTAPIFCETDFVLSAADKKVVVTGRKGGGGVNSSLPPLRVESAERQSREEMEAVMSSARLLEFDPSGNLLCSSDKEGTDFPRGLSVLPLSADTFSALQSLHEVVVGALAAELRLTPWAGVGESDVRKRGYAFLPSRFGKFGKGPLTAAGVRFHAAEKRGLEARRDEEANWNSCFRLSGAQVSPRHEGALREVVAAVAATVSEKYRACVTLDQLQAIQPNLHSGRDHLPLHIDSPLNDGFGVVIVTICVQRPADILLQASASSRAWAFRASEGCMYVLSGASRNACDHGVLCPLEARSREASSKKQQLLQQAGAAVTAATQQRRKRKRGGVEAQRPGRESLNLRFALHGNVPSKPFFVGDEMNLFQS